MQKQNDEHTEIQIVESLSPLYSANEIAEMTGLTLALYTLQTQISATYRQRFRHY